MTELPSTVDELGDLAQQGAIALVGAMATGVFLAARAGIARLFGRLGPDQEDTVRTQLDADADLVIEAEEIERDEVRGELAPGWRRRLTQLLRTDPDAAEPLRDLLAELTPALAPEGQRWTQTIVARDNAAAYGAQGGNVIHYDAGSWPAAEAGERPDGPR